MKLVQFRSYGAPDVLELADGAVPLPGPGQILLKVAAIGVNPADVKWRSGALDGMMPLNFPHVVGYDVAGTVMELGAGASHFRPGDRVVASVASGYAECALAAEAACARLPDGIDFVQAAALPCPALTGVQMIVEGVRPAKGETVLVTGATGGVGRFAVRAARGLGSRVIAAVRPSHFEEALSLGADEVVALDGHDGVLPATDHFADTVGNRAAAELCRRLNPAGKILTVATSPTRPEELAPSAEFFFYHPDGVALAGIVDAVVRGDIAMPIGHRLPLAAAAEAHRLMEAGRLGGRIILEP